MKLTSAVIAATVLFACPAQATLNISSRPTKNVDCNRGFCVANADNANLNTGDLEALLATTDIRVLTEDEQFQDIEVLSPISWSSTHALSLESDEDDAVHVRSTITVQGTAHLTFVGAGGPQFEKDGAVRFWDMASQLTIEGSDYTLVDSVAGLAQAVAANPQVLVAFANNYDASADGRYKHAPVQTSFDGFLEGLGNRISNLSINDKRADNVGLFATTTSNATVLDLRLVKAKVHGKSAANVGALVGDNLGQIRDCFATGTVGGETGAVGGLAGLNSGSIFDAWADAKVSGGSSTGGIAGSNAGSGQVSDTYATGAVTGGDNDNVGGLVGANSAILSRSYATGHVSGGSHAHVGGVAGTTASVVTLSYWDTDTSGTETGVGKGKQEGVQGLTTAQFQAGLPDGLQDGLWAQSTKLNGGFPYLVTSPPLK